MANTLLRPRPPGRSRRHRQSLTSFETNETNIPPPPYAHSNGENGFEGGSRDDLDLSGIDHQILEHKTKEELSSLLLQASSTLKLTLAASIGQELVQINMELQTKYDVILSQRSPASLAREHVDLKALEFRRSSLSNFGSDRKILEAISHLHSQNELLMTQIRHLEEESSEAQRQGTQRIRLLEKEISLLKSGLELSQQKAHDLESQLEEDRSRELRRIIHRKRLNALRQRLSRPDNRFHSSRDYPPGAEITSDQGSDTQSSPVSPDVSIDTLPELSSITPSKPRSCSFPSEALGSVGPSLPHDDSSFSNQLLQKIADLESANKDLIASQLEIKFRLESLLASGQSNTLDLVLEDSAEVSNISYDPGHSRSPFELPSRNQSESGTQLRRRHVESQIEGRRFTLISSQAPESQVALEQEGYSLLDELSRAREDINGYHPSSHKLASVERSVSSDTHHLTVPGAFESPVRETRLPLTPDNGVLGLESSPISTLNKLQDDPTSTTADETSLEPIVRQIRTSTQQRPSLFLEIWIFLQFCVVVVVFMFSMGRRSPILHSDRA